MNDLKKHPLKLGSRQEFIAKLLAVIFFITLVVSLMFPTITRTPLPEKASIISMVMMGGSLFGFLFIISGAKHKSLKKRLAFLMVMALIFLIGYLVLVYFLENFFLPTIPK